jgi:hypothetical protein
MAQEVEHLMEQENIILSEVSQVQKARSHVFSHMWNTDLI